MARSAPSAAAAASIPLSPPRPSHSQTLLRLLLSILRGPLTADEAAAGGSGVEGVQRAGELRPAAEGPVLDLGESRCYATSIVTLQQHCAAVAGGPCWRALCRQLPTWSGHISMRLCVAIPQPCRPGPRARGTRCAPAGVQASAGAAQLPVPVREGAFCRMSLGLVLLPGGCFRLARAEFLAEQCG